MSDPNDSYEFDLLCIRSGPAGQRGAVQAAKLRKKVGVIERSLEVGGVCLHMGTIPSKTFREAVLAMTNGLRNRRVGDHQENGARNLAVELFSRVDDIVARESRIQFDQLRRNGVEVLTGEAEFVDAHTVRVISGKGVRTVSAAKILIAVGTRSTWPGNIPRDTPCVITSDEVPRITDLPRSLVVIGCGVIGTEYASMFASLGVDVTVVDGRDRPLEFLDPEITDELVHQLRVHNVSFRLGETVERVECRDGPPQQAVLYLESGKRLVADLVLASIGRTGAAVSLAIHKAGLCHDERGRIEVDEKFRTSVPHIYAAGDVIGYPSLAATSSEQGRLAACDAFGLDVQTMPEHFPIGIYSIPEISMAGRAEHTLTAERVPYETGVARYREIARGQILGDHSGFLKLIFHAETRLLLGVHVIGTGATELVHIGQAVLGLGGGLDYFLNTVFNYPALAECYKVASLDAYNKLSL